MISWATCPSRMPELNEFSTTFVTVVTIFSNSSVSPRMTVVSCVRLFSDRISSIASARSISSSEKGRLETNVPSSCVLNSRPYCCMFLSSWNAFDSISMTSSLTPGVYPYLGSTLSAAAFLLSSVATISSTSLVALIVTCEIVPTRRSYFLGVHIQKNRPRMIRNVPRIITKQMLEEECSQLLNECSLFFFISCSFLF